MKILGRFRKKPQPVTLSDLEVRAVQQKHVQALLDEHDRLIDELTVRGNALEKENEK